MYYDNPFIKLLETIANMMIVSFLWILFSLPIITFMASCSAMYHTMVKIIFGEGRGNGVLRDFFESYKQNLIPGIKLSVIIIILSLFILEGLWTGYQFYKVNIFGMLYMMLGILITLVVVPTVINVGPVLSRFDAPVSSILRIAAYMTLKKPLRALFNVALLALAILAFYVFPLIVLITPALYTDLIRIPIELDMEQIIAENNLAEIVVEAPIVEEAVEEVSASDIDRELHEKGKKGKK